MSEPTYCDGCCEEKPAPHPVCPVCVLAAMNKTSLRLDKDRLDWLESCWIPNMDEFYMKILTSPDLRARLESLKFKDGGIRGMIDVLRAHLSGGVA